MIEIIKKYRLDANIFSNEKDPDTTVCIVGKSSALAGKGLGKLIDSHDIVVRINPWYTEYAHIHPVDKGTKNNHITSNPYHIFRDSLRRDRIEDLKRALSEMTDSGNNKKTLYVPIRDESWFRHRNNGPHLGLEQGEFTIREKIENYERATTLCEKFGVTLKVRKMTSLVKSINDMMVYFNHVVPNSHGLLTGTEAVLYYMEHFKNVSVAGFSWSMEGYDEIKALGDWWNQCEYDWFFLNQALNRGLITKLEHTE